MTRYYSRAVTIMDADQLAGAMVEQLAQLFDSRMAGLTRERGIGEAFTMLTTEPGPMSRPITGGKSPCCQARRRAWLDYSSPAAELLKPLPGGA